MECAWASLRYNPWAKGVYERIYGGQKTRKKKAAIALARKLAVIAWAMLRDDQDWEPNKMIAVTKSFGGKLPMDEEALRNMPKKECRHKRKRRLAKEQRTAEQTTKQASDQQQTKPTANRTTKASRTVASRNTPTKTPSRRRARKPVLSD